MLSLRQRRCACARSLHHGGLQLSYFITNAFPFLTQLKNIAYYLHYSARKFFSFQKLRAERKYFLTLEKSHATREVKSKFTIESLHGYIFYQKMNNE